MAGTRLQHPAGPGSRRAMTLIELILVMALLTVLLTIMSPLLSNFFEGRRATEEARRMLALTRFARSEAVSRSTPLELWFDPDGRQYGLRSRYETDEADENQPTREYRLEHGLELTINSAQRDQQGRASIYFLPDGTIDNDSLDEVVIRDSSNEEIAIGRAEVGEGYVIR